MITSRLDPGTTGVRTRWLSSISAHEREVVIVSSSVSGSVIANGILKVSPSSTVIVSGSP